MPASSGVQGPGEMIRCDGPPGLDLLQRDLVVAMDFQVQRRVDLAQPLDQVVGERVVVVDQQDHGRRCLRGSTTVCSLPRWTPVEPEEKKPAFPLN